MLNPETLSSCRFASEIYKLVLTFMALFSSFVCSCVCAPIEIDTAERATTGKTKAEKKQNELRFKWFSHHHPSKLVVRFFEDFHARASFYCEAKLNLMIDDDVYRCGQDYLFRLFIAAECRSVDKHDSRPAQWSECGDSRHRIECTIDWFSSRMGGREELPNEEFLFYYISNLSQWLNCARHTRETSSVAEFTGDWTHVGIHYYLTFV